MDLPIFMRRRSRDPDSVKEYYRTEIYIKYIQSLDKELGLRFGPRTKNAFKLQYLVPSETGFLTFQIRKFCFVVAFPLRKELIEKIKPAIEQYQAFLPQPDTIEEELDQWHRRWQRVAPIERPSNLNDLLDKFDYALRTIFPNIFELIVILCTLPVSTASVERYFSTLGRILTDQRSSMLTERLSDLAICSIYSFLGHKIDFDEVIDIFLAMKNRRA